MISGQLLAELSEVVGSENIEEDDLDRLVHTYGKSARDLLRIRAGDIPRAPDAVVYPGNEAEVQLIVDGAVAADAVVSYGGGSNIAGSLQAPADETRPVISVDLGRLNQVINIDEESGLARIQAGAQGPTWRNSWGAGWTLGHYPDSFTHSTLGGWVATRSSGMQSDKYGDISDIARGMRVVMPGKVLQIRPVPHTSTGPSVREMVLGSEGRLGVITEVTVQVRRIQDVRLILGYLFPSWESGLAAMQEISTSDAHPSITRVSDGKETAFSFATRKKSKRRPHLLVDEQGSDEGPPATGLESGRDLTVLCRLRGRQGACDQAEEDRQGDGRASPAASWSARGRGCSTTRRSLIPRTSATSCSIVVRSVMSRRRQRRGRSCCRCKPDVIAAAEKVYAQLGVPGWIMCHLSHSYHSGACLYFTSPSSTTASTRSVSMSRSRMQSSRRSSTPAAHSRITMRWAPSMPRGWSRTSRRRVCT